jgi:DNA-binding winged helix-turn-helix (wHTH) protein
MTALGFGEFELRGNPPRLYRAGVPVRLQAQPLRLLVLLASRPGRLVSHREIQDHLWRGRVVDYAGGTHVCIRQIRAALGDSAEMPRFVISVARRGYRFLAEVRPLDELEACPPGIGWTSTLRRLASGAALAAILAVAAMVSASGPLGTAARQSGTRAGAEDARTERLYQSALQLSDYEQRDRHLLAHDLVRRALRGNPGHGPSHALLADLYTQHGATYFGIEGAPEIGLVQSHLRLARSLGADVSELLVTRGRHILYRHRDIGLAADSFERAIAVNPSNARAWRLIAQSLYLQGRFDEALAASRRAEALSVDPEGVLRDRLDIYYLSGRFDELFDLHRELGHVQPAGAITIGVAMTLAGRRGEGFDLVVAALRQSGFMIGAESGARDAVREGDVRNAYAWVLAETRRAGNPPLGERTSAMLLALAGDLAGAAGRLEQYLARFQSLQAATQADSLPVLSLRLDPFFQQFRGNAAMRRALVALEAIAPVYPVADASRSLGAESFDL